MYIRVHIFKNTSIIIIIIIISIIAVVASCIGV